MFGMTIMDRSGPVVRLILYRQDDPEGVVVDLGDRLLEFTYEDTAKKLDKVQLTVDNHDLAFFEDEKGLLGGGMLRVSWGYRDKLSLPREVVIKRIRGFRQLQIEGVDLGALMDRVQRTRSWSNVKRSDVARELAVEHGYGDQAQWIDETDETFEIINQLAETDARLLRRLAQLEGLDFYVDPYGFHWRAPRVAEPPAFTWYYSSGEDEQGNIIDLSIETDLLKRVGRSRGKSRDPEKKVTNTHDADTDTVERDALASASQTASPESILLIDKETGAEREALITDSDSPPVYNESHGWGSVASDIAKVSDPASPSYGSGVNLVAFGRSAGSERLTSAYNFDQTTITNNATAAEVAESPRSAASNKKRTEERWKRAERESVKMNITALGDPRIQAKSVAEILGIGSWLSGRYEVRQVTHKISAGSGYTMDLQLRADGINKAGAGHTPKLRAAALNKDLAKAAVLLGTAINFTGQMEEHGLIGDKTYTPKQGDTIGDADPIERVSKE